MAEQLTHHLKCAMGDVGKYVILPGDPGRVPKIAAYLNNAVHINTYREYVTYTGTLEGVKVSVTSTGIGGPSASIAMEELVQLGADTFIRVGTCGGIDSSLLPGDLIIPTGAIRKDGTGREYIPIEFPAVADHGLVCELDEAATRLRNCHHLGVVECKDSYYSQHDPDRMPVSYELHQKWEAWKKAGALGSEMESATLYIVASTLRVRCATVLLLCRNLEREAFLKAGEVSVWDTTPAIETAIEAMRSLIKKDKSKD
jgi:uridine phosphorylase